MDGTEADPEGALLVVEPAENIRRRTYIEAGTPTDIDVLNTRLDVLAE